MQRDRSMAVDVISEFLHTGGPPLNADDAAIAIVDVLEREGFNLDRVRDARGDDIPPNDGSGYVTGTAYQRAVAHYEALLATRPPQGEDHEAGFRFQLPSPSLADHEAGKRAALIAWEAGEDEGAEAIDALLDRAIAAYLARVSPSRDGTVAVEDVARWLDNLSPTIYHKTELRERFLAEFSSASTGDRKDEQ